MTASIPPQTASSLAAHQDLAAALADRYDIEREVGGGGMAAVFVAHERKHGRTVAIKVVKPEVAASVGGERFLREIATVARLSHPHIVPLIDSGESGGLLYYISPYVTGGSLRDRLNREKRLAVAEALRIVQDVGAALDYAHRNGFVHRDVKPENILFADGQALLADFGIARTSSATDDNRLTDWGFAIGTPQYMSPEQASGEPNLEAASDIYSLGCVLFEMLAGEPPFGGDGSRTVIAQHIAETPRRLRAVRPDAPQAVEDAVARALAKNPRDRFATVTDFLTALRVDASVTLSSRQATRSVAVLPFANTSPDPENEYLSDGITDELINALAKVEALRVTSRTSVFALKGKPQDVRSIGALLGVSFVLGGSVRKVGQQLRVTAELISTNDGQLLWSERYDRQLHDVFAIQDEIARTIVNTLLATSFADVAAELPTRRGTASVTAYGLYLRGRYEWNKRTAENTAAAIKFFEQAVAVDPNYAGAYTGLADSYALHVDYRSVPVHEGFARAKEYALRALELDETLPEAHASLGWTLFIYDWDWEGAANEFRRAIELDPRYASAHQWYAFVLVSQGRIDEALVEGHTAVELDPASVSIRRSLGWLYYYARRYDDARRYLMRAVEMNPTAAETYRVLGLSLAVQGELEEAERVLREALLNPAAGTYTLATLAFTLGRAGRYDEAREIRSQLAGTAKDDYVSPIAFATIDLGLEEWESALDWIERAMEDRRGWLAYLNFHPIVDPIRSHARFQKLLKQMKL
jgi:serine/threonine protein kinase/tetratricopeptide (TPR) repeat protein